jgi:hypothetical protein
MQVFMHKACKGWCKFDISITNPEKKDQLHKKKCAENDQIKQPNKPSRGRVINILDCASMTAYNYNFITAHNLNFK